MPCCSESIEYIDIFNSKSEAGVLSEVFRNNVNTKRSLSSHFSISGRGKLSNYFLNDHIYSYYTFDEYSPYSKFVKTPNSKILFLGLGKTPTKITAFHCGAYDVRQNVPFYQNVYESDESECIIKTDKVIRKK